MIRLRVSRKWLILLTMRRDIFISPKWLVLLMSLFVLVLSPRRWVTSRLRLRICRRVLVLFTVVLIVSLRCLMVLSLSPSLICLSCRCRRRMSPISRMRSSAP